MTLPTATSYNPSYRYGEARPRRFPFVTSAAASAPANTGGPGVIVNVGDLCFASGPTRTVTDGATTNTSPTLTSATALWTPGDVGAAVSGAGIPGNTTILSVQSSTSVTMSANATATASNVSVTITPTQAVSVYPAISYPWTTNLATSQANFVKQFVGVAAQQFDGTNSSAYGIQDGTLRIDCGGVYDFACASQTWNTGDLVGVAQDTAGNFLAGQLVTNVNANGAGSAIGRVVQPATSAVTVVRVEIFASAMSLVNAGQI